MTQALTRYDTLFESLRSRRRRPEALEGLDRWVGLAGTKAGGLRIPRRALIHQAREVDALAPAIRGYSEAALDEAVRDMREVFIRNRQDQRAVLRACALVREVARRETGEEPYPVQVTAALALWNGRIVEMLTGEGKTLTGAVAATLIAWRRRRLHIFTVNDYLARRDAASRQCIYKRCGLTVGAIQHEQEPGERAGIYSRSIVYGTPKQITADWLRDQIRMGRLGSAWTARQFLASVGEAAVASGAFAPIVPGLRAALVDEADAVLIDEGVVPLIIARARREDDMASIYKEAAEIAAKLDEGPDYSIDHLRRKAELRRRGRHRAYNMFAHLPDPIWRAQRRAEELIRQALVARHCYLRGRQYQVVDGRVVIVDEYTGRFLADRSWEHGLHQAVEAKEGVEVTADRETLARMSFQRFFRSYPFLCGMTGTAADARVEMEAVYSRPVTVIPTNRPMIREQWPTRVFRSAESKYAAIVESIQAQHAQNRPVLVGTRSIEVSELISERLAARALEHRVLNANFDKEEADLITDAGRAGAITVATNMAGRGTDIKLDDAARQAGGLHVILTEMHTAKRIDRQFIGRSGRQGDPGSAQIFVSLEDELVRLFAPGLADSLRRRRWGAWGGWAGAEELRFAGPARAVFRTAQRRAEARARRDRAAVQRQDDWVEKRLPGG